MVDWKLEEHIEECDGDPGTPFAGRCPMCGDTYDEYFKHIKQCEGTLGGEENAAAVGADMEPTDGWVWE